MQGIGVPKIGGLKAAYAIRATRRRASSPRVHLGHRASRPSCSFCSIGACETLWRKAAFATAR